MNKAAALYKFFSGFGIDAYPATAVPPKANFPYMTYDVTLDDWGGNPVSITASLWFYTSSESTPNELVDRIGRTIGLGGTLLHCEGGVIWLKKGTPWCNSLTESSEPNVKRRILNLDIEYLTI